MCKPASYTADADELIAFAEAWRDLGWSVQDQVRAAVSGSRNPDEFNRNAIAEAQDRLGGKNETIDRELAAVAEWLDTLDATEAEAEGEDR